MRKKTKIEIDVDGVLANMDGGYTPYVKHLIPDFSEEKYIKSWGMVEVGKASPEALDIIQGLWRNPTYIRNLERYEGIVEGFRLLSQLPNTEIIIHTHILDDGDVVKARYDWIKQLEKDCGGKFTIDICVGSAKIMRTDTNIIIEDSVRNLNNSFAKEKFLIRRCHNRNLTEDDIVNYDSCYVVSSFFQAAKIIYSQRMQLIHAKS